MILVKEYYNHVHHHLHLGAQLGAQFCANWRNSARNVAQIGAILTPIGLHYPQADEKQMQDMQANLKDSGMSGTMYRREDLAGIGWGTAQLAPFPLIPSPGSLLIAS